MKLIYTGRLSQVQVPVGDRQVTCKRGESCELPDEIGTRLKARKDFRAAKAPKAKKDSGE